MSIILAKIIQIKAINMIFKLLDDNINWVVVMSKLLQW